MTNPPKNTICLWYDGAAEEAANFYARTFPDSAVRALHRAPADFPSGKKGDVLTVEFTVLGIPCLGLNGGAMFRHNEAFSFQVATADQIETDGFRRGHTHQNTSRVHRASGRDDRQRSRRFHSGQARSSASRVHRAFRRDGPETVWGFHRGQGGFHRRPDPSDVPLRRSRVHGTGSRTARCDAQFP